MTGSHSTIGNSVSSAEEFLTQELGSTSEKLIQIEQQISNFKNDNALSLPDLYPATIRELQEIRGQMERAKDNIADLQRNIDATTTDLAITNPDALLMSDDLVASYCWHYSLSWGLAWQQRRLLLACCFVILSGSEMSCLPWSRVAAWCKCRGLG